MELGLQDIRTLIDMIEGSSIGELSFESNGTRIVLKKGTPAAPQLPHAPAMPAVLEKRESGHVIKSPMVGTFYLAPSPESPPYVQVGDRVVAGQPLCIIEAMKLMNEIEADKEGVISQVLVKNGESVEFGQALFALELV